MGDKHHAPLTPQSIMCYLILSISSSKDETSLYMFKNQLNRDGSNIQRDPPQLSFKTKLYTELLLFTKYDVLDFSKCCVTTVNSDDDYKKVVIGSVLKELKVQTDDLLIKLPV